MVMVFLICSLKLNVVKEADFKQWAEKNKSNVQVLNDS